MPASEVFPKTPEFMKKVYGFCIDHYKKTAPFFHGDCTLENIMVDGDDLYLIDLIQVCTLYYMIYRKLYLPLICTVKHLNVSLFYYI